MGSDEPEKAAQNGRPSDEPRLAAAGTRVQITLNGVIAALEDGTPRVLCIDARGGRPGLPFGPFDPAVHRTFEIGLRSWVSEQTRLSLGFVEQLYTFGDRGRAGTGRTLTTGTATDDHLVSVGYLALTEKPEAVEVEGGRWRNWYRFFPWEDWRMGEPPVLSAEILPRLHDWLLAIGDRARAERRQRRFRLAFGLNDLGWEEERILDRFELMYEAGLVEEAPWHDPNAPTFGQSMISDHRRILATAIGRLRGKLKYRPVIFEMMPERFTLFDLQRAVESIIGFQLHKQNFRRSVEGAGLVVRTGQQTSSTGGRPAALFIANRDILRDRAATGLMISRLRRSPGGPGTDVFTGNSD